MCKQNRAVLLKYELFFLTLLFRADIKRIRMHTYIFTDLFPDGWWRGGGETIEFDSAQHISANDFCRSYFNGPPTPLPHPLKSWIRFDYENIYMQVKFIKFNEYLKCFASYINKLRACVIHLWLRCSNRSLNPRVRMNFIFYIA